MEPHIHTAPVLPGEASAFSRGQAVHAWLIAGPEGSGKRAFAHAAAQTLLCSSPQDDEKPCGHCPACIRVRTGNHPDLLTLRPQKATLGVDEVRALLSSLGQRAFEGGRRAVIIEQAHKLTPQAQNALLKSLEEPSGDITFFLLANDLTQILTTIRSRCRLHRMRPTGDVAAVLTARGASPSWAQELALRSGGAQALALDMLEDRAVKAARDTAEQILTLASPAALPPLWQSIREDKDGAAEILTWLECFFADMLRHLGGAAAVLSETPARSARFTIARVNCIIEEILNVRRKLASNVAWQNAVEPLLFVIAEGEKR